MTTLSSLFLPTTYVSMEAMEAAETGVNASGPTFNDNGAGLAEYKSFISFAMADAKAGKGNMGDNAWLDSEFSAFLKREGQWWSGDFRIPYTSIVFNKWLGYAGAAGALWFLLR